MILSKEFQSDKLTLSSALDELDASLGSLEQLCTNGHTFTKFVAEFDDSSNPSSFCGIDITGGKRELDATRKSLRTLAIKSKEYLERRFKVDGIFQDFDIIDPTNWPASGSERGIIEYGLEEITHILQHYQLLFPQELHRQILHQWLQLKLHVCKKLHLSDRNFFDTS